MIMPRYALDWNGICVGMLYEYKRRGIRICGEKNGEMEFQKKEILIPREAGGGSGDGAQHDLEHASCAYEVKS